MIAVGGHSRKIGKTSVMCALIAATREANWTAVKISARRQGGDGIEVIEETEASPEHDTGRYLLAGARRALRIRARDEEIPHAAEILRGIIAESENTIVESNRVAELIEPDLFVFVLQPEVEDFKDSARRVFPSVDVFLSAGGGPMPESWPAGLQPKQEEALAISSADWAPEGLILQVRRIVSAT